MQKKLVKLPPEIRINQLKKGHFQKYIDQRLSEKNDQSKAFILPETVNKELSAVSVALKNAPLHFPDLEDDSIPTVPKARETGRRRERLVGKENELFVLLEHLRKGARTKAAAEYRRTLADTLEIRYETGPRRKEVVRLKKPQCYAREAALRDVVRWKTGTVTKFFPLTQRAVEIIESRLDSDSDYIFSKNGKADESSYRTLKKACEHLDIPYGTHSGGGWVPHDLRPNFATETVRVTDIETAKSLTGHSGAHILRCRHTDEKRQRAAMNKREGRELKEVPTDIYNQVKNGSIDVSAFVEKVGYLIKNG